MTGILWAVVPLAILIGLYRLTFRVESHWASKDGHRFVCQVQSIAAPGAVDGRPREVARPRPTRRPPDGVATATR